MPCSVKCPECGSTNVEEVGYVEDEDVTEYDCLDCGEDFGDD